MRRKALSIAALTLLILLLDRAFRYIHPEVNLVRASLVGLSGYLGLLALHAARPGLLRPAAGGLSVFASAFLSVLLIEGGVLISRSPLSGLVHVIILAAAFLVLDHLAPVTSPARRHP
jgi:hypothetical protein